VSVVDGMSATLAAPASTDVTQTVYSLQSETAQFSSDHAAPRAFVAGGVDGTITVPKLFTSLLITTSDHATTTGEIVVPSLPLVFDMGGETTTVDFALTTGLVTSAGQVFAGKSVDYPNGFYTLVGLGTSPTLPAPLGGVPLLVSISCLANPPPDSHQFERSLDSAILGGSITSKTFSLRALFAPAPNLVPDYSQPALFRAAAGSATVAAGALPAGLTAHGKRLFVSTSSDKTVSMGVRFFHHRLGMDEYLFAAKIKSPTLPAAAPGSTTTLSFTYQVGGLIGRFAGTFKPNRKGIKFSFVK